MGCAPSKDKPVGKGDCEQVAQPAQTQVPAHGKPQDGAVCVKPGWEYPAGPSSASSRPRSEDERLQLLHSLGLLNTPKDPKFDSITLLLCTVFNVPTAFVSLADSEKKWFQRENGEAGSQEAQAAKLLWKLLPEHSEILIVPDALSDARLRDNQLVRGEPYLRFYAGCPLLATEGGQRLGSLCLVDVKPHQEFSTEQHSMLAQFGELIVREIEKEKARAAPGAPTLLSTQGPFDPSAAARLAPAGPPRAAGAEGPEAPVTPLSPTASSTHSGLPPLAALDSMQGAVREHILQRSSAPVRSVSSSRAASPVRHPVLLQSHSAPPLHEDRVWPPAGEPPVVAEGQLGGEHAALTRAVDALAEGAALLDVSSPSWSILHTNAAFSVTSGLPPDEAETQGFWDLFFSQGLSPGDFQVALAAGQSFTMLATLQACYSLTARSLQVDFRPASTQLQLTPAGSRAASALTGAASANGSVITLAPTPEAGPLDLGSVASNDTGGVAAGDGHTSRSSAAAPSSPEGPCPRHYYFAILRPHQAGGGGGNAVQQAQQAQQQPQGAYRGVDLGGSLQQQQQSADLGPFWASAGSDGGGSILLTQQQQAAQAHGTPPFSDATAASANMTGWELLLQQPSTGPSAALQRQQQLAASLKQAMPTAFTDVKLGSLIGRGAYGRVYRGGWNGNIVAVKVIEYQEEVDANGEPVGTVAHARNAIFEAVLSSSLSHPNVVHTYQYAIRRLESDDHVRATPLSPQQQQQQQQQQQAQVHLQQQLLLQQQQQQQPPLSGGSQQQQQLSRASQQQEEEMQRRQTPGEGRLSWEPQEANATTAANSPEPQLPPGRNASAAPSAAPSVSPGAVTPGAMTPGGVTPGGSAGAGTAWTPAAQSSMGGGDGSWPLSDSLRPGGGSVAAGGGTRVVNSEVWLVQEFCNRGPLLSAVERGAFLSTSGNQIGPNLISVLQTLQEIAAALQYLHQHNVVHGDLTGGNVLLTTSDKDTRGFTAKVVDFGLSRVCTEQYLRTRTLGCAEYMPPELITDGILTTAADVYAYGVLAWEVFMGRRAWEGLKPAEVLRKVANGARLSFPKQTPHRLKVLAERCMEYDPMSRPSFKEVVCELNSIIADTMNVLHRFLAASAAQAEGGAGGQLHGGEGVGFMLDEVEEGPLPSDPFR